MSCVACLQKRQDLIAKAVARLGEYPDQAKVDAITSEIIEGRPRRYCEGCGRRIPQYHGMQYSGFQSQSIHHFHDTEEVPGQALPAGGTIIHHGQASAKQVNFQTPIHTELCHECYLVDYAAVYPGAPVPQIANADFS